MLILAMESSAKPASVAVLSGGILLSQIFQNSGLTHSRTLLVMIEDIIKNLDLKPSDIELAAVASGPGSFTGVRIGVSAVKGFAWGLDIPVCGISTLEAMAYQTAGMDMIICAVMDARRDQVYNALFQWRDGVLIRLCADRAVSLNELADDLASDLYDRDRPVLLVGDGAGISHNFLTARDPLSKRCIPDCRIAPELLRYQTAYGVALAAANAVNAANTVNAAANAVNAPVNASDLEPCYLRPSQAERELKR